MIRILFLLLASPAIADPIVLQSTTSTQNSGLYDAILPVFTAQTGIEVRVVAVGTGQALKNAQNCDGDLLIVHARKAEDEFVAAGFGTDRADLMYNDFVIVGPPSDPAGIRASESAQEALVAISQNEARFMSRGDDSGTHKAEQRLWAPTGVAPQDFSGTWYLETGAGMGATLNTARGLNAYTLTDRATWLRFSNKGDFEILFEGDPAMFNQYGVVQIAPNHCPNANLDDAATLRNWLLSDGQGVIADYKVQSQQLFFPNAVEID